MFIVRIIFWLLVIFFGLICVVLISDSQTWTDTFSISLFLILGGFPLIISVYLLARVSGWIPKRSENDAQLSTKQISENLATSVTVRFGDEACVWELDTIPPSTYEKFFKYAQELSERSSALGFKTTIDGDWAVSFT